MILAITRCDLRLAAELARQIRANLERKGAK